MRTRCSYFPITTNVTIPRRHQRKQTSNIVEPESQTIVEMADNRTMAQMLQAPIEGYEDAIVVPPINANNFKLKQTLINLVQSNKFTGRQDPYNHLRFFNKVTSTFRHPEVLNSTIKLLLFPFSLEGEARTWLDKEPPRSILTWEDLVSKFINQFFPSSKTTYLWDEIINFLQKPNETFNEAWERFKDLLRQCPHHGFSKFHQLDTFYNALNPNDQDALDSAAGGNFMDKIPRECLSIIKSKSKVRYSRSRVLIRDVNQWTKMLIFLVLTKFKPHSILMFILRLKKQYAKPEDPNELFQKLLEDLKELAEYDNSPSRDHPIFFNDDEDHSVQDKEHLENSSNEIAASNSDQEKEKPPQDSDIRQLIREECCIEVCEEQKQKIEDTILELVEIYRQKELYCMHDNIEDLIESALNTKLLSINSQRFDKKEREVKNVVEQPAKCGTRIEKSLQNFRIIHKSSIFLNNTSQISSVHESDEIIKSGVEELVPIPNEYEVTSEDKREGDIVSVEEENVVHQEEEKVNLEDIQDVVLREKLLSINHLIANIESLKDNPTPVCVLNSFALIPIFVESDNSLSDNFSLKFETFCDHAEETRSGSTITHADNSLPEYDSFCFEIEPDQKKLTNAVINNISVESSIDPLLEEADLFLASDNSITPDDEFDLNPDSGEVISAVMKNIDELNKDECFDPGEEINVSTKYEDVDYFPFIFVIRIFLPYLIYPEVSPLFLSAKSEDTIFDPVSPFRASGISLDLPLSD
nr:reverse transcriptase domain-containing protein [Tanacetum cinerariifolium]